MTATNRTPAYPVDRAFVDRWSPRSFSDAEISDETLMTMLEAARWAPSSYNVQPWRFVYAKRGDAAWPDFLSTLIEFNRIWAERAAALVMFVSESHRMVKGERQPWATHAFDAGAAWANFAHQAHLLGWYTHGMAGFDPARAREVMAIPADFTPNALVAVGRRGPVEALPEMMQSREVPSDRMPLAETAFAGKFPAA